MKRPHSHNISSQATRAVVSIFAFILVYLLLTCMALALTVICTYFGYQMAVLHPSTVTILIGIGLVSFGLLILIFLLKFTFKVHKVDRSQYREITRGEAPKLFELIDEIVGEVQTQFPKKVYLSSEVNASVFYDSTFWSMFFPIRKNLMIGMGLVNATDLSELRAILGHEFGHFSQRSMKVGSYVYNSNRIIHDMLFENEGYDNMVQKWAETSGYFAIFVLLAVKVNQGIQWIFRKVYELVNRNYLALSREMEYQADEIAAGVAGSRPLETFLLRMNLAQHALDTVLAYYGQKTQKQIRSKNVFREQEFIMNYLALQNNTPITNGLPYVSLSNLRRFDKSKLTVEDQWASHPSLEDRIARLRKLKTKDVGREGRSSRHIFEDYVALEEELTQELFPKELKSSVPEDSLASFKADFVEAYQAGSFPEIYRGYYDDKNPLLKSMRAPAGLDQVTLESLFADDKLDRVYTSLALQADLEVLQHIVAGQINVRTFDYDGLKYHVSDAEDLLQQLRGELQSLNDELEVHESRIFHFFQKREYASATGHRLEGLYKALRGHADQYDEKIEIYNQLQAATHFIHFNTPFDEIRRNFHTVERLEEKLRIQISEMLDDPTYQEQCNADVRDSLQLYMSKKWRYFGHDKYYEKNLGILFDAMQNYQFVLSNRFFQLKKELLVYQAKLMQRDIDEEQ